MNMKYKDFYSELFPEKKLEEVHFSDVFPRAFMDFYKKWKSQKNDKSLYVRFDNGNTTDVLAKSPSENPNHSDPVGVYAYPLKYVIEHPGDVWYGHNSKYLKVIRDRSKNKIVLTYLEPWRAKILLRKAGIDDYYLELAGKYYPERKKGKAAVGKLFMSAVQMDFSNADSPIKVKKSGTFGDAKSPAIKGSKEQTKILLKMGIDALEDASKNIKDAAINDREPEQIVWFRPTSYEILETFRMADKKGFGGNVIANEDSIKRKLAAKIAEIINDTIKETDTYNKFWTVGERMIDIDSYDVSLDYRMKNMKIGQKPHKFFKKSDKTGFKIQVFSERGDFTETMYSDDKIKDVISRIKDKWKSSENNNNGKKYSKSSYEAEQKRLRDIAISERIKKENLEIIDRWDNSFVKYYNNIATKIGLELINNTDFSKKQKIDTYKLMRTDEEMVNKFKEYHTAGNLNVVFGYYKMLKHIGNNRISRFPDLNLREIAYNLGASGDDL